MLPPIVWIAAAFAAGIALGRGSVLSAWTWLAVSSAAAAAGVWCLDIRRSAVAPLLAGTLAAGALWATLHADPIAAPALTGTFGTDVTLTGLVVRLPQGGEVRGRVVISVDHINSDGRSERAYGLVLVTIPGTSTIRYGDRIAVSGRLVRPPPAGNPGEFSYRDYLVTRGIAATLYPHGQAGVRKIGRGRVNPVLAAADVVRRGMTSFLQTALPGRRGALMTSLLLGDDGAIGPQARDDFARSGLLHVLVVSGAQVGLVLGSVLWLGRALRIPALFASVTAAAITVFFALMTGWVPSVARAAIVALIGLAAPLVRRSQDARAALAFAALALLVSQPLLLFDAGFQLSFAATWGLVYVAPVLATRLSALPRALRALFAMTAAAQIAVVPLLAYHFLQISVVGFVANLAVVPLVALLVPAGFAVAAVGAVAPAIGTPFAPVLGPPADAVWWAAAFCARLPLSAVPVGPPPLLEIAAFYAAVVVIVESLQGRLRVARRAMAAVVSTTAALGLWIQVLAAAAPPQLVVTFLDVGQGDSIVIQGPSGRAVLVDGGGEVEGHLTGYDIGARRVVPALRRLRLRGIDVLLLSHPHEDHVGGLVAVLQNFPVGLVLDSGFVHPAPSYPRFLRLVEEKQVPYRLARRGQLLDLGGGAAAVLLNPREPLVIGSGSDVHANSVVARLVYGTASVLLTGDIEALTEAILLSEGTDLRSTVLKVAHHGSATSSTPAFLEAVAPRVAVISVGAMNPFGHPHRATLDALHAVGAAVYRTDVHGAVTVSTDGTQLWVRAVRDAGDR